MHNAKNRHILSLASTLLGGVALGALVYGFGHAILGEGPLATLGALAAASGLPALMLQRADRSGSVEAEALQSLADEIWIIDAKTEEVLYLNAAATQRTGLELQVKPRLKVSDIISKSQPEALRAFLARPEMDKSIALQRGQSSLRATVTPLDDRRRLMLVLRDVTQELAEEKAKTDFISTVSHELRSPLTSIKGSMGLLLSNAAGELPKPARNLLEIAHRNAERLVLIINDILDLQKIVDGGMDFEKQPVDASALVHEALDASSLFMQRFDLNIEVVGTDQPVEINSDPNRIIQVLGNLLTNAAKFSRPHSTVTITLMQTANSVTIQVRDQGAGIPKDEQVKIFERFTDMSNSDRQQKGGSGLGLSICKAIIDNLDGSIGFESTEDVGTTFYITLPRGGVAQKDQDHEEDIRNAG